MADDWEREIGQDLLELAVERLPAGTLGFDDASMSVSEHARLSGLLARRASSSSPRAG